MTKFMEVNMFNMKKSNGLINISVKIILSRLMINRLYKKYPDYSGYSYYLLF